MSTQAARIRSVELLEAFILRLSRDVDLEGELWGPMFERLRADPELFRRVRVDEELGTIVWPNGADRDPDVLHVDFDAADNATTRHISRAKS